MGLAGRIATFYSYKGGTGRSMALANFAWILAENGKRVLVIDWDLEAPGLHRYFRPFLIDPDLEETDGLIDCFWNLVASGLQTVNASNKSEPSTDAIMRASSAFDAATRRLNCGNFFGTTNNDGFIDFIGAGRQGAAYSERVTTFDWRRFYELGGASMLEEAKNHFRQKYDWILIDSRTGVSDTSGICTMQMPSIVIPCFTMNRQSIEGVSSVLRSIRDYQSPTVTGSEIDFFPVATRIENAESKRLQVARSYARSVLAEFLPQPYRTPSGEVDYWQKMEITYRPHFAFEEVLVAFGDEGGRLRASDSMLTQMEQLSRLVSADPLLTVRDVSLEDREWALAIYSLEQQMRVATAAEESDRFGNSDDAFNRLIRAKEWNWWRSKKTWRLLLSRSELDRLDRSPGARKLYGIFYKAHSFEEYAETSRVVLRDLFRLRVFYYPVLLLAVLAAYGIWTEFELLQSSFATDLLATIFGVLGLILLFWGAIWMGLSVLFRLTGRGNSLSLRSIFLLLFAGPFEARIRDYNWYNDRPIRERNYRLSSFLQFVIAAGLATLNLTPLLLFQSSGGATADLGAIVGGFVAQDMMEQPGRSTPTEGIVMIYSFAKYGSIRQRDDAIKALKSRSYDVRLNEPSVPDVSPLQIRYYHREDRPEADIVKSIVEDATKVRLRMVDRTSDVQSVARHPRGTIEIWLYTQYLPPE